METTWTNVFEMVASVRARVAETGVKATVHDNPFRRVLGYRHGEDVWHISLTDAKTSLAVASSPESAEAFRRGLSTQAGRLLLVNSD